MADGWLAPPSSLPPLQAPLTPSSYPGIRDIGEINVERRGEGGGGVVCRGEGRGRQRGPLVVVVVVVSRKGENGKEEEELYNLSS